MPPNYGRHSAAMVPSGGSSSSSSSSNSSSSHHNTSVTSPTQPMRRLRARSNEDLSILDEMIQDRVDKGHIIRSVRGTVRVAANNNKKEEVEEETTVAESRMETATQVEEDLESFEPVAVTTPTVDSFQAAVVAV